jgi:hypothetical protein
MTPPDDMELPQGKTCADCMHNARCVVFGFTKPQNTRCDFAPSRFVEREPGWSACGHPSGSDTCPRCGP